MGSVTVGQANVSPIELGRRRRNDNDPRRRDFATRDQHSSEQGLAGHLGYASHLLMDSRHLDLELRAATARSAGLLCSDGEVDAAHRVLVAAIDTSWSRTDRDIPGLLEALHTLSAVCYFGGRAELWTPFHRILGLLGDAVPPVLRLIARTCPDPVATSPAALLDADRHISRLRTGDPDPAETVLVGLVAQAVDRLPDWRDELQRVFLGAGDQSSSDWAVWAGLLLAADAVHAGQWTEAEALAEQCIGRCETTGRRLWAWSGRYVLALVAAGRGQWTDYRASTNEVVEWAKPRGVLTLISETALGIPEAERLTFEIARAQLAFGERLRRRQATRASREHLSAAFDTFTRLGAEPWAERASAELRATGRTRRRSDGNSPVSLTAQELGISELAATGLTNKQIGAKLFLSPRTVSAHLYRVFPKLGITSRAALRDALRALPSPG